MTEIITCDKDILDAGWAITIHADNGRYFAQADRGSTLLSKGADNPKSALNAVAAQIMEMGQ